MKMTPSRKSMKLLAVLVLLAASTALAWQEPAPVPPAPEPAAAPSQAPEPAPVPAPVPGQTSTEAVTLPVGTSLLIRMIDGIDSKTNRVGDIFHASLEDQLVIGDRVIARKGADIYGRLAEAQSAGKVKGKSELRLELTGIRVNGQIQTIVTSTYEVAGGSRGKQTAGRVGGGAAIGAIIGAIAGGGKGAAIGAGVGAGAGTAVQLATHGEQVKVPSETLFEFKLDQSANLIVPNPRP